MGGSSQTGSNPAWSLVRDLIADRTGIYFDQGSLDLMTTKISDLMADVDVDSPLDYYYLLKYEAGSGGEWQKVQNAISVRETYFARERDQIRALAGVVISRLAKESSGPIRIWSAACATGEEPVSIAMALHENGWLDSIPVEIYASDFSSTALCAAQRGVFRERSFRVLSEELRNRYFTRVSDGWQVDPQLHRRIVWVRANLTRRSDIEELARSSVIFCRNVFIYFSDSAIRKVVKTFEDCMPRPGYLFMGAAESLLKFTTQFHLQQIEGAFLYVKD